MQKCKYNTYVYVKVHINHENYKNPRQDVFLFISANF